MLGRTANNLYWMFRYLERCENTARLCDAGFRIALTRSEAADDEWASVIDTVSARAQFEDRHDSYLGSNVVDFLLRDTSNPGSVINMIGHARENARAARTALTQQVWESVNESWLQLSKALKKPIDAKNLTDTLNLIQERSALVQGTMQGTMLRNDVFNFTRIGTLIERADNTSRILDVKYYVLLPSVSLIGTSLDNVQWEVILRSVSAHRSYHWLNKTDVNPAGIAEFMILDRRMPRSLMFCVSEIARHLGELSKTYNTVLPSRNMACAQLEELEKMTVNKIFDLGLHETIRTYIDNNNALARQIEQDYRFTD